MLPDRDAAVGGPGRVRAGRPLEHWREPDQGLWDDRGEPKHFTASKVMCWVAASRGADLARRRGDDERARQWQAGADEIRAEVLEKGLSDRGVFRQHYETGDLDASLLLLMGFLPPSDERMRATVLAIADELTKDDLSCGTGSREPTPGSPARRERSPSARSGWCRRWR